MATNVHKKAIKPIFLFNEVEDLVLPEVLKYKDNVQMSLDEDFKKGLRIRTVFPENIPMGHQGVLSGNKSMSAEVLLDTFIKQNKEPLGLPYLLALLREQHYIKSFFYGIRFLEILDMKMLFEKAGIWHSVCLKKQKERIVLGISEYVASDKDGRILINQSGRISTSSVRFLVSTIERLKEEYSAKESNPPIEEVVGKMKIVNNIEEEEHPLKNKMIG